MSAYPRIDQTIPGRSPRLDNPFNDPYRLDNSSTSTFDISKAGASDSDHTCIDYSGTIALASIKHQDESSMTWDTKSHDQLISSPHATIPSAQPTTDAPRKKAKKTLRFWLIFLSLMSVTCLAAVDMTIMSTTLPTVVAALPASSLSGSWVTSAFLLTTTAFQPLMGGLADVLGRRYAMALSVVFFIVGSVISAVAQSMLVLVVGRGIQGIGGGGTQAVAEIVLSDLTTLRERGLYVGLISLVFAVATFIAPVLGGIFSQHNWRWVFWINVPIGGVALILILATMKLNTPKMPLKEKWHRMDLFANMVLLGSVVSLLVALTDGSVKHPWSSWRIYVPLAAGVTGMVLFFILEFTDNPLSKDPVLPRKLFSNRTAGACFASTFFHGLITYGLIYMIPIYFQAVHLSTPLRSAVQLFPATAPSPFAAILAGIIMTVTGKYLIQTWIYWVITVVGCGLLCLLSTDTPTWQWVLFQVVAGYGIGALFALTLPPIQASLPVEELAHATATFSFCRSFGSVWGIALGTNVFITIVNDKLDKIPGLKELGLTGSTALGFSTELGKLPEQLRQPAQDAYMSSLYKSFLVFVPLAFVGLLISLFVQELPLPDFNDSKHGLRESSIHASPTFDFQDKLSDSTSDFHRETHATSRPGDAVCAEGSHVRNRSTQRLSFPAHPSLQRNYSRSSANDWRLSSQAFAY